MTGQLAIIAARLPAAVRSGDEAGAALLLEKVTSPRQMEELVKLLAGCADRRMLLAATGYPPPLSPPEAHAAYEAHRKAGAGRLGIPFHVRAGENAYQQESRRRRKGAAA